MQRSRRHRLTLASAMVLGLIFPLALAAPATAAPPVPSGAVKRYVLIGGVCLNSGAKSGATQQNVDLNRCPGPGEYPWTSDLNAQFWIYRVKVGNAYPFEIRHLRSERCLDSDASGKVYLHECNGGDYQRWYSIRNPYAGIDPAGRLNYPGEKTMLENAGTRRYLAVQEGLSGKSLITATELFTSVSSKRLK